MTNFSPKPPLDGFGFMCNRLPIVNKAAIIVIFNGNESVQNVHATQYTRSDIQSFIVLLVKRLGKIKERPICSYDAIIFKA